MTPEPVQSQWKQWLPMLIGTGGVMAVLLLWYTFLVQKAMSQALVAGIFLGMGLVVVCLVVLVLLLLLATQQQAAAHRALLNAMPDLMIRMSRSGGYLDFIPGKDFTVAWPETEVGKNIYQVMPTKLANQRLHFIEQALKTGKSQVYEYQVQINGRVYYQEGRVVVSGQDEVLVIVRDITDRKQIEVAFERLSHQNELILNSAGEGICGVDLQGRITFMNPAASRMLGYQMGELLFQPLHGTIYYNKPDGTPYPLEESPIYTSLREGNIQHRSNEVFWRQDGSCFPVEYISTPIRERHYINPVGEVGDASSLSPLVQTSESEAFQDEIVGTVVIFRDITERQSIDRMKDEFISVVSHELRTPLTSIRGALGLIATGKLGTLAERGQHLLEIAVANADRLVRLVNDILDLERIESGRITMEKRFCDAADLMQQAAATMHPLVDKAGITLSVTPLSVPLWADSDRIIQTLTNLLSNAIKFSPPQSTIWVKATIISQPETADRDNLLLSTSSAHFSPPTSAAYHLPAAPPRSSLLFSIQDQGRGIPIDKIEMIFGRFQQVDASDSREKGGTGLGLAICRSIIQQHGGKIWAESVLGKGSTFYFTLPLSGPDEVLSEAGSYDS
ncbi:hypothetical protein BST81_07630 [Leptolyngbya sp. 'hensonii']|uniref:PAS domain-containing sensor histidine kinase n=1 Tax=Leptolyngbya sp. 'hensonii' TaxID=1922337 RepID=UPI00094FABF8|nr:ATP-binding protein [Leptolyngbya sp. 'hensonii']OLP19073.1 hypothetical protein BST81_07630 [Leptolyngbya sp. 'hensonii']